MRAFLFDIGNVILFFDFGVAVRRIAARCDLAEEQILPALSELTAQFERGEMDTATFSAAATERIGFAGEAGELVAALEDIFTLNQPMVELIEELKADGHPLYLLSNTNAIHAPYFSGRYPVFGHFDGATYSHQVGAMKPSQAIYESAINNFALDPANTVYIDDVADNVAAGKAAGLLAICYDGKDHGQFLNAVAGLNT